MHLNNYTLVEFNEPKTKIKIVNFTTFFIKKHVFKNNSWPLLMPDLFVAHVVKSI